MTLGPRPALALTLPAIAGALMTLAQPVSAQSDAPKADSLERAQKAADAVFHWIKVNADKNPRPAPPPAPVVRKPAPVAAAPREAPAPAPTPVRMQVEAVSAPAPRPAPSPAPAPAPAPAVAAMAPEPEPERTPVVLASAPPLPAPAAPLAAAAQAVQPPPPAEEAEVPLKLLVKVDPAIPRQLQATSFRNGFAQVQFTVAPDGTVIKAEATKSSHARLASAAVEAVRQWRFAPIPKAREAAVEVAFRNEDE